MVLQMFSQYDAAKSLVSVESFRVTFLRGFNNLTGEIINLGDVLNTSYYHILPAEYYYRISSLLKSFPSHVDTESTEETL